MQNVKNVKDLRDMLENIKLICNIYNLEIKGSDNIANSMEPIKDFKMIKDISDYLLVSSVRHGQRNQLLWLMGIYFGLRISKLLEFKVRDVRNKDIVFTRGNKRNRERKLIINKELKKYIENFIEDKEDFEYLFESQKSKKPIGREMAYRILRDAGRVFDLEHIGSHTLRKTYGYIIYIQSGKDPVAVKEALNVKSVEVALRYIGIVKDQSSIIMNNIRLLS